MRQKRISRGKKRKLLKNPTDQEVQRYGVSSKKTTEQLGVINTSEEETSSHVENGDIPDRSLERSF